MTEAWKTPEFRQMTWLLLTAAVAPVAGVLLQLGIAAGIYAWKWVAGRL